MAQNTIIKGYRADLATDWQPLSDIHRNYLERLDQYLTQFCRGNKTIPRIAIVGAYRQGKTQLLFQAFKMSWEKGAVAIYIHADQLVKLIEKRTGPDGKIIPSELPQLVKEAIVSDINNLETDQGLFLLHEDVVPYVKTLIQHVEGKPLVLLIDELEASYEMLQNKIATNDRNPIRSLLDASDIYTILAFAPRSIYEFKRGATLGEGEAERGRLDVFNLPPVSAIQISAFLKVDRPSANLIWWLSRGRAGQSIRVYNTLKNYDIGADAGLLSFTESLGKISGVPCLNIDAMMDKQGNLLHDWRGILNLVPQPSLMQNEWALSFKLDSGFNARGTQFFGKLGFSGANSMGLANYLFLLLDAISGVDNEPVIKTKDVASLVRATYELALEHTSDEGFSGIIQRKLDELLSDPNLKHNLSYVMEEVGLAERGKPQNLLSIDFEKLLEFFPFPLSSPQLPGAPKDAVDDWLNTVGQSPLAQETEGEANMLLFKDFAHFKHYCESRKRDFVESSLPEKRRTAIFILHGDIPSKDRPALAQWLEKQGRLLIEKLRPSLLADFLANALFLVHPKTSEPSRALSDDLKALRQQFEQEGDRATAIKIERYLGGLSDSFATAIRNFKEQLRSIEDRTKVISIGQTFERQKSSHAFFYPFTLGLWPDDSDGLRALAQIRSWADGSGRPLYGYLPEEAGYRTAVGYLPFAHRKGIIQSSDAVKEIRESCLDLTDDLDNLAALLSKDEFRLLVGNDLGRFVLDAYYESRHFQGISQGEKEKVVGQLKQALSRQASILAEEDMIKKSIGMGFEASLKFSPEQENAIRELLTSLEKADSWQSVVYQRVFYAFTEQIAASTLARADEFWKSLQNLPTDDYNALKELNKIFEIPDKFPEDVFRYVGISREKLAGQIKRAWKDSREDLLQRGIQGLSGSTISAICENLGHLIKAQEYFTRIREHLEDIKQQVMQEYIEIKES